MDARGGLLDASLPSVETEAREPWIRRFREILLILGLSLTLNLAGNDRVGLWDRDEPRYATCTREMAERGDWLSPTFNGQPRYHKPILIYWLMRFGYAVGGDNPFGARLVSGFAGAATCLLTWRLGRSIVGPEAGMLASLSLACVPIMVAESKLATTDATLACLVVAAQGCLWGLSRRDSTGLAIGFWLAMGLATLLKGPVGLAFVAASGVVSWWWGGPTVCWRRLRWRTGLLVFAALTVPWFVTVGWLSRGEFFRFAFQTQIVQRISSGMEQHGGFPGYYPLVSLPMFFPWSALMPAAILAGWRLRRTSPAFGFLLGWVVGPWLVLECFGTKIIHYYLPCFPACALLMGWLVVEVAKSGGVLRDWSLGARLLGVIGFGASMILAGVALTIAPRPLRASMLAMAGIMALGTLLARIAIERRRPLEACRGLVVTWSVLMLISGAWLLPSAEPYRFSRIVGERLGQLATSTGIRPAMMTFQEPGLVYSLGHPACDVRGYDEMADEIRKRGPILLPLLTSEVVEMRNDPRFVVKIVEPISGFNTNKGKVQELEFAVVEASPSSVARSSEKPGVK
jgi:4-amino-4-deoxy-L-arabinose transferase-like glycosyltransferase